MTPPLGRRACCGDRSSPQGQHFAAARAQVSCQDCSRLRNHGEAARQVGPAAWLAPLHARGRRTDVERVEPSPFQGAQQDDQGVRKAPAARLLPHSLIGSWIPEDPLAAPRRLATVALVISRRLSSIWQPLSPWCSPESLPYRPRRCFCRSSRRSAVGGCPADPRRADPSSLPDPPTASRLSKNRAVAHRRTPRPTTRRSALSSISPISNGFQVFRTIRQGRMSAPVLILSSRTSIEDRVHGLESGADDYAARPFAFPELVAHVRAFSRRGPIQREVVLSAGDLRLDATRHEVYGAIRRSTCRARSSRCLKRPGKSRLAYCPARICSSTGGVSARDPLERRRGLRRLPTRQARPTLRAQKPADGPCRRLPALRRRIDAGGALRRQR
jgi:CheY-like chemotaxis protein